MIEGHRSRCINIMLILRAVQVVGLWPDRRRSICLAAIILATTACTLLPMIVFEPPRYKLGWHKEQN